MSPRRFFCCWPPRPLLLPPRPGTGPLLVGASG